MLAHWPDTYKYSGTIPDGLGMFDLMCGRYDDFNPVPPNPLFLSNVGWMKNYDVTDFNGIKQDTSNSLSCYKYQNVNNSDEFFLLKGRLLENRNVTIPDDGLIIWHIDRNGDNQTAHPEVAIDHAVGDVGGDHSDAGYKPSTVDHFDNTTTPAALFYNDDYNALKVWDISNAGQYMSYKFGAGAPAASLKLMSGSLSNESNANGFLDPGETADVTAEAFNLGTLSAGTITTITEALGVTASYVTVNTPSVTNGAIAAGSSANIAVNITIDPLTPVGTLIVLRQTATDGSVVRIIKQSFRIGKIITIANGIVTECQGLFVDPGGAEAGYVEFTDVEQTIKAPAGSNQLTVNFTDFDVEYEPTICGYDYLEIYDGASTADPFIGRFCGTNSPGSITSTNADAALTFVFHSDESVTGAGWQAIVGCGNSLLPVDLIAFTGKATACTANLSWQSAHELNNDFYEVQYSTNATDFTTAGRVKSNNSQNGGSYSFTYNSLNDDHNYFRLKMVDKNGAFKYSDVIKVTANCKRIIALSPNPAKTYTILSGLQAGMHILVKDAAGRVLTKTIATNETYKLPLVKLPAGIYFISVINGEKVTNLRLLKQ